LYKDFSKNVVEIMQSVLDKEKCFGVVCKANASFGKSLGDLREIDL
jgi:hypothetical protein